MRLVDFLQYYKAKIKIENSSSYRVERETTLGISQMLQGQNHIWLTEQTNFQLVFASSHNHFEHFAPF